MKSMSCRGGFLALVAAMIALTVKSFNLPTINSFDSTILLTSKKVTESRKTSNHLKRGRGVALASGVEDYGPQFASYLQNDVTPYTVGEVHPLKGSVIKYLENDGAV